MARTRVLIVDDSALIRAGLTKILTQDPDIEVVGTAPDPIIAEEKIKILNPDVITLDIEMPRMDGVTFLEKLMKTNPMPVVMISTLTYSHSESVIKALTLGAVDYIEKPSGINVDSINEEIIAKVKNAARCAIKKMKKDHIDEKPIQVTNKLPQAYTNIFQNKKNDKTNIAGEKSNKIILLGASTGGTVAIENIIKELPAKMPGIVIVQHMPQNFTKAFADRLDTLCQMKVKEAQNGDIVCDGTVYIAPGGLQCYLSKNMGHYSIIINDDPPVNRHKPSVDAMFLSASKNSCNNIIGVILTGMGKDGAKGLLELRKAGSYNIAQDEESSIVFGMPKEAIEIGAAHEVLSLNKIAARLVSLSR